MYSTGRKVLLKIMSHGINKKKTSYIVIPHKKKGYITIKKQNNYNYLSSRWNIQTVTIATHYATMNECNEWTDGRQEVICISDRVLYESRCRRSSCIVEIHHVTLYSFFFFHSREFFFHFMHKKKKARKWKWRRVHVLTLKLSRKFVTKKKKKPVTIANWSLLVLFFQR